MRLRLNPLVAALSSENAKIRSSLDLLWLNNSWNPNESEKSLDSDSISDRRVPALLEATLSDLTHEITDGRELPPPASSSSLEKWKHFIVGGERSSLYALNSPAEAEKTQRKKV